MMMIRMMMMNANDEMVHGHEHMLVWNDDDCYY